MINAVAQYRRALKKELRCSSKAKKRLLTGFDQTLTAYLEENSNPSMEELSAAFGPPEEMAKVLMAELTAQEQTQYRRNILIRRLFLTALALVFLVLTIYICFYKSVGLTSTSELNQIPVDWAESSNAASEDSSK